MEPTLDPGVALIGLILLCGFALIVGVQLARITEGSLLQRLEMRSRRMAAVQAAADQLGLRFRGSHGDRTEANADGEIGRFVLRVRLAADGLARHTVVEVSGVGRHRVRLRPAHPLLGVGRLRTADDAFDAVVHAFGPASQVLATLSAPIRAEILRLVRKGAALEDGALVWRDSDVRSADAIVEVAHDLAEVAEQLFAARGTPARDALVDHVRGDPNPDFRVRCLTTLLRSYPGAPETEEAVQIALLDADPVVSGAARRALGKDQSGELSVAGEASRGGLSRPVEA